MAHIRQILANLSISVSDFKKSPKTVIKAAKNEPIAVIIDNKPAFYCVPADILESLYQKVYEMNDMALQNIEHLNNDVSVSMSAPPVDDAFGVNDVFEAIEDEHEVNRTIHNEALIDPLNTQVADPLDEEVAHQINMSIDQHLQSIKDKSLAAGGDEFSDDTFTECDDSDSSELSDISSDLSSMAETDLCHHPASGSDNNSILDKINNLDPKLAKDFTYPYAKSSSMDLEQNDELMNAANQDHQAEFNESMSSLDMFEGSSDSMSGADILTDNLSSDFNSKLQDPLSSDISDDLASIAQDHDDLMEHDFSDQLIDEAHPLADPITTTTALTKRIEDKAALREIISEVKQEIKDSESARHLISTPYDLSLEKVARTYRPYNGKPHKSKGSDKNDPAPALTTLGKQPSQKEKAKSPVKLEQIAPSESSLSTLYKRSDKSKSAKDGKKSKGKDGKEDKAAKSTKELKSAKSKGAKSKASAKEGKASKDKA